MKQHKFSASAVTSTGLLWCLRCKNLLAMQATWVRFPGCKHPLEKGMATHSNILAWRNPRTEEPCGLHTLGSQRVGHDWVTNTPVHSRGLISIISSPIFLFSSCFVHSIKSTRLSIPNSYILPPPPTPHFKPLVYIHVFSMSVSLLLLWNKIIYIIFLQSFITKLLNIVRSMKLYSMFGLLIFIF